MDGAVRLKTDFTSVSIKPCPAERPSTCCVPIDTMLQPMKMLLAEANNVVVSTDMWLFTIRIKNNSLPLLSKNISALLANIIMSHFWGGEYKTRRKKLAGDTEGFWSMKVRFGWNTKIWSSPMWDLLVKKGPCELVERCFEPGVL